MGAALVLLLVALGAMAAGVLIGRYYVPDDRQLRRTARHSRAYMRALSHLIARDHDTVMAELRAVVEENIEDVEPYFALGALFRSRGEHERAIRVHQALTVRERDRRKLRHRAMYELGLDFRAAGMPRRATRAMENVVLEEPGHEGALRALAALYEEQARFNDAAGMWQRLGRRRGEDMSHREHHLLVAAAQAALGRDDPDAAKQLLKAAQHHAESAHLFTAAAELAAARGNHRGAKERLKQALAADPGLAPHLLPGLIAAEQGLAGEAAHDGRRHRDDLEDDAAEALALVAGAAQSAQAAGASQSALTAGVSTSSPLLTSASSTTLAASSPVSSSSTTLSASSSSLPDASSSSSSLPVSASSSSLPVSASSSSLPVSASSSSLPVSASSPVSSELAPGATSTSPHASDGAAASSQTASGVALGATGVQAASANEAPTGAELAATSQALMAIMRPKTEPAIATVRAAPEGIALVPEHRLGITVAERVLAVLAEVEAATGPRLELALIRAQLVPANDGAAQAALARELTAQFPDALAARVATARLAIASGDPGAIRGALDSLVAEHGALAWALRGRWQCAHCGNRPGPFSWRCGQCRRWNTLRMETGIAPPPVAPRERRAAPRVARPEGLLGAARDEGLPAATLDGGLSDAELATAGTRRSLLGRVGGWVSGVWRRDAS